MEGKPKQAALTVAAAKAAAAAGVKSAALVTRINPHDPSIPKPAFELTEKKLDPKASAKKPAPRSKQRKAAKAGHPAPKKQTAKHSVSRVSAHSAAPKADAKKSAVATSTTAPKPSPAVAKPSAGSN
jgi:hypothetical protein